MSDKVDEQKVGSDMMNAEEDDEYIDTIDLTVENPVVVESGNIVTVRKMRHMMKVLIFDNFCVV